MRALNIILLMFVAGCHSSGDVEHLFVNEVSTDFEEMMDVPVTMHAPPAPHQIENNQQTKKLIKTGRITFQSKNIEDVYKKITNLLPQYQAYIEHENQSKSTHRINYNLTLRVPSNIFDTLYTTVSDIAYRIESRYSNMEDVTERYYDLKTRIKNKQALEQRYLEILIKANEIKDILEIERNLNAVRTEIESMQGQFNYLSKEINFSTLTLSFYEELPYVYDASGRDGFGARILSALDNGWQGFLSFLVGITTLWPFIFLLIGVIYIFKKLKVKWGIKNILRTKK